MPQGLPRKIRYAFVTQGLLLALAVVFGVSLVTLFTRDALVTQRLVVEAEGFWERQAAGGPRVLPSNRTMQGYFRPAQGGPPVPPDIEGLPEGISYLYASHQAVLVQGGPGGVLYLVLRTNTVDRLMGSSALAMILLGLLVAVAITSLTYRKSRSIVLPVNRLAEEVSRWDPTHGDLTPPLASTSLSGEQSREVRALSQALNGLAARVAEFVQRERNFTRDASHELRTPLTVIRSACERLGARTDLPGEAQRQLQHVCRSAQQLERTVATLLALAREDVDTSAPEIAVLPVLERVIVDQAPLLEGRDVSIRVEVPHATQARLPAPVLHTVLSNLVGNAFAHGGSGDVVIDVDAGGLRIANPGAWPGEMAFRPFVKSEASAGVGLGLAIVRRLCARHRIALRFESEGLATIVHLALAPSGDA